MPFLLAVNNAQETEMANTTPTGAGSNGGTTTVVANPPNPPTVNKVPNTTTNAETVEYQTAASESVFDPRQEPAESVFNPGPTYNGPGTEESVFDPRQDVGENVFDPNAALPNPAVTAAAQLNDPTAGLSPTQLQKLGGADPTDPYVRARLGIPQLPGSTLNASGFGLPKLTTGFAPIDNALGTIGGLFSGLFNKTTKTSVAGATDYGSAYKTPDYNTAELSRQATQVRATDSTLTPNAETNLTNINEANAQIDKANVNTQVNNRSILANEESQAAAQEQQRRAQAIIDQNNAELADPSIGDERRAELEANNAAQLSSIAENAAVIDEAQNNIDSATANNEAQQASILENEIAAQANADAFVINNNGNGPPQVSALEDPGIQENVFDPGVGQPVSESVFDPTQDVGENVFDPGETFNADGESVFDPENVDPNTDPFEEARFQAQLAAEENVPIEFEPADVPVLTDEEADALDAQQAENRRVLATEATDVEPGLFSGQTDEFGGVDAAVAARQAENVNPDTNPGYGSSLNTDSASALAERNDAAAVDAAAASDTKAKLANAQAQSTIQQRFNQTTQGDWRVRLSLATGSDYLYNSDDPGILKVLKSTNGIIFPYTPSIQTNYTANYDKYELTHSNHRGYFYKNSQVGDIQITGAFTAQDTAEATYLLAVIHFFRSVTKMFYGQDEQRGAPPPLCFLDGMGEYQFNNHPVLISSFQYNLPADVDYIRVDPNNQGLSLAPRQQLTSSSPGSTLSSVINRLKNAGLPKGANPGGPVDLGTVQQKVNGTGQTTYVPTKIEISITLLPVNTRSQVSQQFSLNRFANGDLLKQGFW